MDEIKDDGGLDKDECSADRSVDSVTSILPLSIEVVVEAMTRSLPSGVSTVFTPDDLLVEPCV